MFLKNQNVSMVAEVSFDNNIDLLEHIATFHTKQSLYDILDALMCYTS